MKRELLITGVLILAFFGLLLCGCEEEKPNPDHYAIVDKWDDEFVIIYGSDRRKLQLDKDQFSWVKLGDRVSIDGDKVTLTRPAVEIVH